MIDPTRSITRRSFAAILKLKLQCILSPPDYERFTWHEWCTVCFTRKREREREKEKEIDRRKWLEERESVNLADD